MPKLLTQLTDLQNLDMRIDENAAQRDSLAQSLADTTELDAARAALDSTAHVSAETRAKLKALELETASLVEKLSHVSERLYSGRIANPKELSGLNQDEKMLQKNKSELEDRELALMEQIETTDSDLEAKRRAFEQVSAQTTGRQAHDRAALHDLEVAAAALFDKRAALVPQIPADVLPVYDHLRSTKKGRAVTHLKGNSCGSCGYEVPSGLLARVKAGDELVQCSNCGRILAS